MNMPTLVPPFGSGGGKFRKRKQLVKLLPEHETYVEPYAGSLAVLYAKPISLVEVVSDLDKNIAFVHRYIKGITPEKVAALRKKNWISSKKLFKQFVNGPVPANDLDHFYQLIYRAHCSYSGISGKSYSYGDQGKPVNAVLDRLELCALRLNNVEILNQEALEVMQKYDSADTAFYLDPPYEEDWDEAKYGVKSFDAEEFCKALGKLKGKFLLSYENTAKARELLKGYTCRKMAFQRTLHLHSPMPAYTDYELLVANYSLPARITKADIDDFTSQLGLPTFLEEDFTDFIEVNKSNNSNNGNSIDNEDELITLPTAELQKLYNDWASGLRARRQTFQISPIEKGIRQLFGMPGGKKRLASVLAEIISKQKHKTYVEPFAGGAVVFFKKEPSEKEVLADIDSDAIFAYKFVQKITEDQIKQLEKKKWTANEDYFYKLRGQKEPKAAIEKFYRYIYLKHFSYGKGKEHAGRGQDSWAFDTGAVDNRFNYHLVSRLPLVRERLQNIIIEQADYGQTIKKYDGKDTLFYIDHPYFGEEVDGTSIEPDEFHKAIKAIKGKWLVSLNDTPENRVAFKNCNICTVHLGRRFDSGGDKGAVRDKELLIANFPLPEKIIKAASDKLEEGEEDLTRDEQRGLLQEEIGDWYLAKENGKEHRFVVQYHVRGIWDRDTVKQVRKDLSTASTQEELDEVWSANDCIYLKTSLEALSKDLQRVDDARGDVTKAARKHLAEDAPKLADLDLQKVFNKGNCHVDFRNNEPNGRFLIGWTCDVVKIVLQDLQDELHFPLRNRFLENESGDNWLSQRKNPQPLAWLKIVSPSKPEWEAEPEMVGATKHTSGRFILKASGQMVYGVQKTDYNEYFLFFDQKEYRKLNGRFDFRIIPSRGEYTKTPEKAFWMGSRPWKTQQPYILTHNEAEEEAKAKKDKIEMVWNEETIAALQELDYPDLAGIEKFRLEVPILKIDKEKQLAIGPLLVPNKIDAQNDFATANDIEEAAHRAVEDGPPKILLMHQGKPIDASVVESHIYRKLNIPEGSWVGAVKVRDKEVWKKIKAGVLKGFSIGGTGARLKVKLREK